MPECELQALIADLEKAEAGSRELDCRIFECISERLKIYASSEVESFHRGSDGVYTVNTKDGYRHLDACRAPHYTTSTDAALTLVPAEYYLLDAEENPKGGDWVFCLRKREHGHPKTDGEGIAFTPALALCIAALKAREAGE